jgi:hypothetical protein
MTVLFQNIRKIMGWCPKVGAMEIKKALHFFWALGHPFCGYRTFRFYIGSGKTGRH